jgi:S-adenosylmethionine hydrolase
LASSYAAVEKRQPLALINSWGLLEIAANQDSAARLFHAGIGDRINVSVS